MKKAERLMNSEYNESVLEWSESSNSLVFQDLKDTVNQQFESSPERFSNDSSAFTIIDYGCTTGGTSIGVFKALIDAVRIKNEKKEILAVLNDLPECRYDVTFQTV